MSTITEEMQLRWYEAENKPSHYQMGRKSSLKHPVYIVHYNNQVFVSCFVKDMVLRYNLSSINTIKPSNPNIPRDSRTDPRNPPEISGDSLSWGQPVVFAAGGYCKPYGSCVRLNGPWGLEVDKKNEHLLVGSFGGDRILVFDLNSGSLTSVFGDSESLDSPEGLALDPSTRILYVSSFLDSRIVKFHIDTHKYKGTLLPTTTGIQGPEDLIFDGAGNLWVSTSRHRIFRLKIHPSNHTIASVMDASIIIDSDGSSPAFSAQTTTRRLSREEEFELEYRRYKHRKRLAGFVGLAVGPEGHILVSSYHSHNILRFDKDYLRFRDVYIQTSNLRGPTGISLSKSGSSLQLFVASYENHRVFSFHAKLNTQDPKDVGRDNVASSRMHPKDFQQLYSY
ncbi:hypothetical protein AAMO2058_000567700 [Amorphochlora amoebiformis]